MGNNNQKALQTLQAASKQKDKLNLSENPAVRARQVEELYFAGVLDQNLPPNIINEVIFAVDNDGDAIVQFETKDGTKFAVVVVLEDYTHLNWRECRALRHAIQIGERGTTMSIRQVPEIVARLEANYGMCTSNVQNGRYVIVCKPGRGKEQEMTETSLIQVGLKVDYSNQTIGVIAQNSKEQFAFVLNLLHQKMHLAIKDCTCLADILLVLETGDPVDLIRFLSYACQMQMKFNEAVMTGDDKLAICIITPTMVERTEPIDPKLAAAALLDKRRREVDAQAKQRLNQNPNEARQVLKYPGVEITAQMEVISGQAFLFRGRYQSQEVVVKVFKNADGEEYRDELRGLLKVGGHRNVIPVLNFFEAPMPCIVMRFVSGGNLNQYLITKAIEFCQKQSCCTYGATGKSTDYKQKWYYCQTCSPNKQNLGCCVACAKKCHAGHVLVEKSASGFYCDCGGGALPTTCKSLKSLKGESVLSNELALSVILGVANGLKYLHQNGFVHRDMKSLNILMDGEHPVIIDMGLGKQMDNNATLVQTSSLKGSPLWMAPEMFASSSYSDKTDVYAFAIIMWEIMASQFPYQDVRFEPNLVMGGKLRPTLSLCGSRPAFLTKVMQDCWENEPKKRPSMSDVVSRLEAGERTKKDPQILFKEANKNGSGQMDFAEFTTFLTSLGVKLNPREQLSLFEAIDSDHGGSIDFAEFQKWWALMERGGLEAALAFRAKSNNAGSIPPNSIHPIIPNIPNTPNNASLYVSIGKSTPVVGGGQGKAMGFGIPQDMGAARGNLKPANASPSQPPATKHSPQQPAPFFQLRPTQPKSGGVSPVNSKEALPPTPPKMAPPSPGPPKQPAPPQPTSPPTYKPIAPPQMQAENMVPPPPLDPLNSEVAEMLTQLNFHSKYSRLFQEQALDMESLKELNDVEWERLVVPLGDRKKIQRYVKGGSLLVTTTSVNPTMTNFNNNNNNNNNNNTLDSAQIPPSWKNVLIQAGIKLEDLNDDQFSMLVTSIIAGEDPGMNDASSAEKASVRMGLLKAKATQKMQQPPPSNMVQTLSNAMKNAQTKKQ